MILPGNNIRSEQMLAFPIGMSMADFGGTYVKRCANQGLMLIISITFIFLSNIN